MQTSRGDIEAAIKRQLVEICDAIGEDARELGEEDLIPASGLVDSAGLLELLAWYEGHFGVALKPEEITIDNLGSIRLMAEYVLKRRGAG
jgi:acyl carrier protein